MDTLKPPFPYFGGKRRVADLVWSYLGDVDLYIEPFAGSLAVLLGRPPLHKHRRCELVNDFDAYIVNFWRAMRGDPAKVYEWSQDPIGEADLVARNNWLIKTSEERKAKMLADPDFYDAKVAGWWVWGLSVWIGSGWAQNVSGAKLPKVSAQGVLTKNTDLAYFAALGERLKDVRVVHGSWKRVLTDGVFANSQSTIGVFLDPPYSGDLTKGIYSNESDSIAPKVREWCIKNGGDRNKRIILAGYYDEHGGKMPGWEELKYKAGPSYNTAESSKRDDGNAKNRHKETLWISPHCRKAGGLLGATAATARLVR